MKKTYNTYICVSATNYSIIPTINTGFLYTAVESCKLKVHTRLSYTEAKQQMVKLAVKHNLRIKREVNSLSPDIVTYSISGFLD